MCAYPVDILLKNFARHAILWNSRRGNAAGNGKLLENGRSVSELGQFQGGGHAGRSSADNDDLGLVLLVGLVAGHSFVIDEDGESFLAECEHLLASSLNQRISSLWKLNGNSAVEVKQAKVLFNASQNALASTAVATLNGRQCRLFDSSFDAQPWSVADALGYLLAESVPNDIETPSLAELDALAGNIDLGRLDVTSKTAAEALATVARLAGLELRSARHRRGLVFYRPGEQGKRRRIRLQTPGSTLSLAKSNLWQSRIHLRRRPSRRGLLLLGQRKQYESTFELEKGWDASLETSRWRDFVRSKSGNWPKVADVYRKWVLNEHGWYSSNPWNLAIHSFEDINSDDFSTRAARKFLPCLSTDKQGQSLGVVVEIRLGLGAAWRRWRGPLWTSKDECAIYLGGNELPGEFFQACVNNDASIRVTAVVEADARLVAEVDGDINAPRDVIDFSTRAAWRSIHSSSIFRDAEGVGTPAERDDSNLLNRLAARHAETASKAIEAELTLGWIDASIYVGDIVERIDGRAFELSSNPDRRPFVKSVQPDFGEKQTTHLLVSG